MGCRGKQVTRYLVMLSLCGFAPTTLAQSNTSKPESYTSPACQISSTWCVGNQPTKVQQPKPQRESYLKDELLLLYDSSKPAELMDTLLKRYRLREKRSDELASVKTKMVTAATNGQDPAELVQTINQQQDTIQANLSTLFYPTAVTTRSAQGDYPLALTGVTAIHQITRGEGVKIGMIDTPIDILHRSLDNSRVQRMELLPAGSKINQKHGTEIAGVLISQNPRIGIAPDAALFAVSAFGTVPNTGTNERASTAGLVAKAIDKCIEAKVDILNLSFAGAEDALVNKMVRKAAENNIIIVASAGNGGPNAKPAFPAALDNVIAVTAIDKKEQVFRAANRGAYIDVAAPGVDILTTAPDGSFNIVSGTSVAAAHVTGVVALLMSMNRRGFKTNLLTDTAIDLGRPGPDEDYGAGLINVERAMRALGYTPPAANTN